MEGRDIREGMTLYSSSEGRVYKGIAEFVGRTGLYVVSPNKVRHYADNITPGGWTRNTTMADVYFPSVFLTRAEAVADAEGWIDPFVEKFQKKLQRLELKREVLQMKAKPWERQEPKQLWIRRSVSKTIAQIKKNHRLDHFDWKCDGWKGAEATLQEAKDAADTALKTDDWVL